MRRGHFPSAVLRFLSLYYYDYYYYFSNSTMSTAAAITSSSSTSSSYPTESQDRLEVLFRQEITFYLTSDYLGTLIQQQQASSTGAAGEDSESTGSNPRMLNQHWREVMCEWAYHGTFDRSILEGFINSFVRWMCVCVLLLWLTLDGIHIHIQNVNVF